MESGEAGKSRRKQVTDGGELLKLARDAARSAYAPYSHFRVGAAVLANGRLFTGCNIENASYGLTICAERVAIFGAVAAGCRRLDALAVSCIDASPGSSANELVPCGACRQVIAQFASSHMPVHVDGVGSYELQELLPNPFELSSTKLGE